MPELPFTAITVAGLQNHLKLRKKFRLSNMFPDSSKFIKRFTVRSELDIGLRGDNVEALTPAMGLMMQLGDNNWLDVDGQYLLYKHKLGLDLKFAQLQLIAVAGWDHMYGHTEFNIQLDEIKPLRAIITGAAAILALGMYVSGGSEVASKKVRKDSSYPVKLAAEIQAGVQRRNATI
eukprot:TRINITY_DN98450_c0_g1_i8.p1 TRINITY_DN98450_c0_g1~~TRINITY_DN98450_c0_g1_i8.p1  ORF type:complete len:177 (-),score=19.08 TRINITY_DN98450_c0_g1_i8:74-604(-)